MKKDKLIESLRELSHVNNFYYKILEEINNNTNKGNDFVEYIKNQTNIKDTVDLVLFLEG